ncbi:MAG: FxsA family protein [Pseudomonadota bacterium]
MPWLLIFFLTPIAEMYLLIEVAGYIDVWPTIFLVMLTAVIGVALLKRQGLATLTRGMQRLDSGQLPAREMAEGILLAVAGALLVTPGFVTDTVGFVLLFPPSRAAIAGQMLKRVQVSAQSAAYTQTFNQEDPLHRPDSAAPPRSGEGREGNGPVTIEGDFERRP